MQLVSPRSIRSQQQIPAVWLALALLLVAPDPARPQTASALPSLADQSLEDLMNIQVTSVSRKEQKLSHAGAAVFVITQEDIHRSGAANIPDVLCMAPGVNVARIDANTWAISIRGFNNRYADKILVLIDGRSVYAPSFSGVYWDQIDVPLEDIERIEVIRGPGGTAWGANAMNGVINIITMSSQATKGGLLVGQAGSKKAAGSRNTEAAPVAREPIASSADTSIRTPLSAPPACPRRMAGTRFREAFGWIWRLRRETR